jgi:hypothetical protein
VNAFLQKGRKPHAYDGDLLRALQLCSHSSDVKATPAMASGVTSKLWEIPDMAQVLEEWEAKGE